MNARALLALLSLLLAPGLALAQTAREPLDLAPDGEVERYQGRVPFRLGDGADFGSPDHDDSVWPTVEVPGYWHAQGLGRGDRTAWYLSLIHI